MREDIVAGAVFPDYELTDHTGKRRRLSELQGPDPMILVLSRGSFCPKDQRQAEGLVRLYREMEVGYSRLVTISTDNMLTTHEYRTGVGAHWTFLSDPGRKVQKEPDIDFIVDANLRLAQETEQLLLDEPTLREGVLAILEGLAPGRYWLVEQEGQVVGQLLITFEWSDWRNRTVWWIQSVYVMRDARK